MNSPQVDNHYFNENRETKNWEARRTDLSKAFIRTFEAAFEESKAYREMYSSNGIDSSDIRSIDDLEQLPIIRMEHLAERQTADPPFGGMNIGALSRVRRIYVNPGMIWQPGARDFSDTSFAEALRASGFGSGDTIVNTFNYHLWPLAFILDESVNMIGASVVPTGVGNTLMQVKILQRLKANGFLGTPSFLMTLAQRAESMGINPRKDLSLKTALVGGEMLPESLRSRIEKKFDMMVNQTYGSVLLGGCIGYECSHRSGLHIPLDLIVEVVDPKTGKQVPPGVAGEIVATTCSDTYPMIRMATGDLSVMTYDSCPCGRTGPMLKKILGRIDQATKVRGTFIHPWQTDEVVSRFAEIFKYQVVITRDDHQDTMTFVIELTEETSNPEVLKARLERDIKDFLNLKGDVRIVPLGTLPEMHAKIEDRREWT